MSRLAQPVSTQKGARLLLPLHRLADRTAPSPTGAAPAVPAVPLRQLDLDADGVGPIAVWHAAVQASTEACLLLNKDARVVAASNSVGAVLGTTSESAVGAKFVDLVTAVDFTSGAAPDLDFERSMPPLRALMTGGLARGLLRLRSSAGLVTYDVVAVPLSAQSGALAFFLAV